jgi:hypothetical protein
MTHTPDTIPEWALKEACKRSGMPWYVYQGNSYSLYAKMSIKAHASTIAKYETPPVDPIRAEAERMVEAWDYDPAANNLVDLVESAIRRGREMGV